MHFKERGRAAFRGGGAQGLDPGYRWGLSCPHVIDRTMVLFSYPFLPHGAKGAFQVTAGMQSGGHKPVQIKEESR